MSDTGKEVCWGAAYWARLKEEFFAECTERDANQYPKINLAPHDLFEWFKKKLSEAEEMKTSKILADSGLLRKHAKSRKDSHP
jgi:hypothetical protein